MNKRIQRYIDKDKLIIWLKGMKESVYGKDPNRVEEKQDWYDALMRDINKFFR